MQNIYDVSANYCTISKQEKEPDKIAEQTHWVPLTKNAVTTAKRVVIYLCLGMRETDALGWLWFTCIQRKSKAIKKKKKKKASSVFKKVGNRQTSGSAALAVLPNESAELYLSFRIFYIPDMKPTSSG